MFHPMGESGQSLLEKTILWIGKYDRILNPRAMNFGFIAALSNSGASLKLCVGVTNLYFPCRHIIVDWLKQYTNCGLVDNVNRIH